MSSQSNSTVTKKNTSSIQKTTNKSVKQSTRTTSTKHTSTITVTNKTIKYGNSVTLVATVADKTLNSYAKSGKVVFKVNGKTVGSTTVSNGKAYYTYNSKSLSVKTYTISAVYGGNSTITSSRNTGYLKVIKQASLMTVSNKSVNAGSSVQLVATIVNNQTNAYITGGKVAFKINGKTVGYGTVSNGKAYYTYSTKSLGAKSYKITATYSGNNKYQSTTGSGTLKITSVSFTYSQVKNAAVYVRNQLESNHMIKTVTVGSTTMGIEDFLPIMINMVNNVKNKKSSSNVAYQNYNSISSQTDTMSTTTLYLSQMITVGNSVLTFYKNINRPPTYVTVNGKKFGYYNIIYCYSKILDVSTTSYLPATTKVYNWTSIHPTAATTRAIYISSDNIYSNTKDKAFVSQIKSLLEAKGFKVYTLGIGPNTHNTAIWAGTLPDNAVQLSLFGGADAGVIYDVCTRSYMRTKANRLVFFAFNANTAKNITGLSWLERAHDDNYSPSSFKGIAHPDTYLKNHGYDYMYYTSASQIVTALIKYIS